MMLQRVIALPVHPAAVIASIALPNKYGHTAKEASEIIAPIAAVKDVSTCLRSSQFRYATGDFSGGLPGGRSRSARTAGKPILGSGDTAIDPKLWEIGRASCRERVEKWMGGDGVGRDK